MFTLWLALAYAGDTTPEQLQEFQELLTANPDAVVLVRVGVEEAVAREWSSGARIWTIPAQANPTAALKLMPADNCAVLLMLQDERWLTTPSSACLAPAPDGINVLFQPALAPPAVARVAPPDDVHADPFDAAPLDDEPVDRVDSHEAAEQKRAAVRLLNAFGTTYGAYVGGEAGWMLGEALEKNESDHRGQNIAPGALGGAVIGGATTLLVTRTSELTPPGVFQMYSGAFEGGFIGSQLTRAILPYDAPAAPERIQAGGLGGTVAGVGLGIAFGERARPIRDQVRTDLGVGIGWIAGTGVSDMLPKYWVDVDANDDLWVDTRPVARRRDAAIALAGGTALGGLAMVANRVGVEDPTAPTLALSFGHGAWIGAWAPFAFTGSPTSRQVLGGLKVGTAAGYTSTLALSAFGQPDAKSTALQAAGWASASAIGAGIPLAASPKLHRREVVGSMLLSGIAGQALGAIVAPHWEMGPDDAALLATLETWTAVQAVGWGMYADATGAESHRSIGGGLIAGGTGTALAIGLVPALDIPPSGSLMLFSGGAWGVWFGGWGGQLATGDADVIWLSMLTAGNGGLGATALAEGLGWKPDWRDVAAINGIGLVGAAAGGLVGAVALYDPETWDPLVTSTIVGSGAGLIAGGIIAATNEPGDTRVAFVVPFHRRIPLRATPLVAPWTTPEGGMGLVVTVTTERQ